MDAPAELDVPIEPIDAGMDAPLDAGSDTPAPPTCNELFMAVIPVYQECGPPPEPGTCRFYTDPEPNASCDTLCGLVPGSTCVRSEADDDTRCASTAHHACDLAQGDTICVCRRP